MTFEHKKLPNLSMSLTENGVKVRVSLNIDPLMVKYLYPWVAKGEFHHVHFLEEEIFEVNKYSIENVYQRLLDKAMMNCRKAKQKILQNQIKSIEYKQTKLNL